MSTPSPTSSSGPQRWKILGEKVLVTTRIFEVRSVKFHHPVRAVERDFAVVAAPDWCNVIAVTPEGHLVLVRQFRYGTNDFSLEIPGGMIEPGEDPVIAAQRELQEETGYTGTSARLLASVHPNPAFLNNRCHFVLVENVTQNQAQAWDHDEEMDVSTAPVDDVLAWARSGKITHSLVICGLMQFEPLWRARTGC